MQVFQNTRNTASQIVVEQNGARVKMLDAQTPLGAHHGFKHNGFTVGQRQRHTLLEVRADRAKVHVEPGHLKNAPHLRQIAQIGRVAHIVLRDHQQVAGFWANFLDGRHGGLHGQRQHVGRQIVPAVGVQAGVHRRQFEAGVAHIDRAVKRWRVLHPLQPEPAFDGRHGIQQALLKLIDWAREGGHQMRNHAALSIGWCPL